MLPVYHTLWASHTLAHIDAYRNGEPSVVFHTHIHRKQSDRIGVSSVHRNCSSQNTRTQRWVDAATSNSIGIATHTHPDTVSFLPLLLHTRPIHSHEPSLTHTADPILSFISVFFPFHTHFFSFAYSFHNIMCTTFQSVSLQSTFKLFARFIFIYSLNRS